MYLQYFLVLCEALKAPINGQVNSTASLLAFGYYSVDTTVSFICDSGYKLEGSSLTSCLNNGTWNDPTPTCRQGSEQTKFGFYS